MTQGEAHLVVMKTLLQYAVMLACVLLITFTSSNAMSTQSSDIP